jgi:branched-chain amino acid transport system permease protein
VIDFINLYLVPGLTIGSVYALGAVGISMIFGILRFAHFAHGDLMTIGGYGVLTAVWFIPLHPLLLLPVGMALAIGAALAVDEFFYKPLRKLPTIYTVIASFGVALIFRSLAQLFWSSGNQVFVSGVRPPMVFFDTFRISELHLQVIILTLIIAIALHFFLTRSKLGRSMRAVSDEPELASVAGLDTERVVRWTWVIGAALAATAGVFAGMDTSMHPNLGWNLLLAMFAAAVLGGIGKPMGAIAGGLIIGIAEETATFTWLSDEPLISPFLQIRGRLLHHGGAASVPAAGAVQGEASVMELTGLLFYLVSVLIAGGIYAVLCLALNVQWGMGGLFNAGIAGFFAVGAYTSAIVTTAVSTKHLGGFELPIPFGLVAAMIVAGVTGWVVAKICVRLKSDYLAMASVGIAEILRLVIVNESWLTNGSLGIAGVPRPFGDLVQGRQADLLYLAMVWLCVLAVYILCQRLYVSPWGRTLRAIRDNEDSARAAGKDVDWFRLQTFVIGCAIMGLAGALSAHYFKFLSPSATEPLLVTFLVWVMLMAGGSGNNKGAIVGALAIWFIWSATEIVTSRLPPEWITRSSYIRMLLVGLLLQFVLQKFRSGLIPEKSPKIRSD